LKKLLETYPDDLKVVFKHNPLSFHKRALPVAKATMAAHMQGKFWEFHDLAFSQKRYDDATMDGYAKQLGLDMAQYRTDRDSEAVHAKILHDQASMVSNGARGTPAFFLNGKSMSGAKPYGAFKTEVDAALKEANAELAKGTALKDLHRVLASRNASAAFVDAVEDGKPARGGKARPSAKKPRDAAPAKAVKVNVAKVDPSMGEPKAAVTVVTFSDFQ
jgi:protein-disulfide isomerase